MHVAMTLDEWERIQKNQKDAVSAAKDEAARFEGALNDLRIEASHLTQRIAKQEVSLSQLQNSRIEDQKVSAISYNRVNTELEAERQRTKSRDALVNSQACKIAEVELRYKIAMESIARKDTEIGSLTDDKNLAWQRVHQLEGFATKVFGAYRVLVVLWNKSFPNKAIDVRELRKEFVEKC